jgi:hypothetical protein
MNLKEENYEEMFGVTHNLSDFHSFIYLNI